jgi:hypothetical protein
MQEEKDYFKLMENPFLLDIEDKMEYTNEELVQIQTLLQNKYIDYIVEDGYNEDFKWPFHHVRDRCTKGLMQQIIDVPNNILPTKDLYKVGDGGDGKNCIVCSTPLSNNRHNFSQSILQSLEEVGFNGHFYLFNGGFPNPTGTEMKYAGVPYSFKIFAILEAHNKGFEKVIWIDAACYAVNNPKRLFDLLDENNVIFRWFYPNQFETEPGKNSYDREVLPQTLELLNKLTERDVRNDYCVNSIVFGLNLNLEIIHDFIAEYYEMVKLGLPFLSTYPEETVFAAIFNKPKYKHVFNYNNEEIFNLYINEHQVDKNAAKSHGFFFLQRKYN